jgi:hypothetical protein
MGVHDPCALEGVAVISNFYILRLSSILGYLKNLPVEVNFLKGFLNFKSMVNKFQKKGTFPKDYLRHP